MARFDYLLDKIERADFADSPFRHIWISDFFSPEDFELIRSASEIAIPEAEDDEALFNRLFDAGYKIITFPGCITDRKAYMKWHRRRSGHKHHSACEGFGMTLRLFEKRSDILKELDDFLSGEKFNRCIAEKFGVDFDACYIDGGIQKYLDGYEISPHPDIRRKALTFMVNINPADDSESLDHHTHYLRFTPERDYIRRFWEGNADVERCWVPWEWCETVKQQRDNNSIVLFSPNNETMHGVKAAYNHLRTQRTQLYGNLWYQECPQLRRMEWEDLELGASRTIGKMSAREALKTLVPESVKPALKKLVTRNRGDIGHRDVRELD